MAKKRTKSGNLPAKATSKRLVPARLLSDLRTLIESTRTGVAQAVNSALVILYWQVGHRIRTETLGSKRATYGQEILSTLSKELVAGYGSGFSVPNLSRMMRLAEVFPNRETVAELSRQLGWSHFVEILPLKTDLQREFYAEMCRIERWSVRTLREKVGGMLFERTALSRKPDELARKELAKLRDEDRLTPDLVFRDPYFLDFLGLKDTYSEKDLEAAILREMEQFILELGGGFTFVARQKRIVIDGEDFYIDLLFYHRKLHRLVALDLKLERFKAADKGQMELYLRWLEKYEMEPGEEAPIGLILCADKRDEQIELLQLDKSGIRVATYLTELPPKKLLEEKLHESARRARVELEGRSPED
ncbi:MAG: PDDEXK nuclease domain-containing protein [Isosphaeraceae bacterium]|jgi:predicted nuclease of restriction endonuclease-like (RecB) superfamily